MAGGDDADALAVEFDVDHVKQAADAVTAFQSGDQPKAAQLLNGSCRHASNQVLLLLKELKRGLGR